MEWLARYRAHNEELAKRLMHRNRKGSSLEAPRSIREICDVCDAPAQMTCEAWMLKRRIPLPEGSLVEFVRRGVDAQRAVDKSGAYVPAQERISAKLIVSRIHRVAARLTSDELRKELYELADEIEARLESK